MCDLEKVPGNVKYLKGWDVGGRKLVLDVSLRGHAKIQGQILNQRRVCSQLFKEHGIP